MLLNDSGSEGGSSPRMRGAQLKLNGFKLNGGIIPADAGSTCDIAKSGAPYWDHPRGCGEHPDGIQIAYTLYGSSPRMRGALSNALSMLMPPRIIPADAGSTCCADLRGDQPQDHPRGCGEHNDPATNVASIVGSSPRMRGARLGEVEYVLGPGIIPADAGSTFRYAVLICLFEDHPRGCGEHEPVSDP